MGVATGIMLAVSAVSSVVQSRAQRAESKAAQNQAVYQSQVASNNAIIAKQNADQAKFSAQLDANEERRDTLRRQSTIRSRFAGAGVSLDGSVLDVLNEEARIGELEAQKTLYAGQIQAQGDKFQQQNFLSQQQASLAQGEQIGRARKVQTGISILSGVSKLGNTASTFLK